MIATIRCIKASDFLLVFGSVAVLVLGYWPPAPPRQRVQVSQADGTVRQFSIPENDPAIAKLKLALEKWGKAGQETRLAVAQWRAELADFYVARTESAARPPTASANLAASSSASGPMRQASFRNPAGASANAAEIPSVVPASDDRQPHLEFWRNLGHRARDSIAEVEEIRRSRKSLETPPPIVFGPLQRGTKPWPALVAALLAGLFVAWLFAFWNHCSPAIRLHSSRVGGGDPMPSAVTEAYGEEIRLVVPSAWVRVRQPISVLARSFAITALVIWACLSLVA